MERHLLTNTKPQLAALIKPWINHDFRGKIPAELTQMLLTDMDTSERQLMLDLLPIAANFSVAPVSGFHVGAIVQDEDNNLYMGANLEIRHEALFHSVHAEQTAVSHAWQDGCKRMKSLAISSSPCGHCRQFLLELDLRRDLLIHVANKSSYYLNEHIHDPFCPSLLNQSEQGTFLVHSNSTLHIDTQDAFILSILKANQSYAPYSKNCAAVGLQLKNQEIFFGRYAENAAFNPSLLPMQCALAMFARSPYDLSDIERVVLIESEQGKISLRNASINALSAVSKVELEHVVACLA